MPRDNRCSACGAAATREMAECAECGHPLERMCECGTTFHVFDDACPSCGKATRRRLRRSRSHGGRLISGVSRGLNAFADQVTAPFRVIGERLRRVPGRTKRDRRTCSDCGTKITRENLRCPGCDADLTAECRCGARYHRKLDRLCPMCGKDPRHRRKRPVNLFLVLLLLAGVAGVIVLTGPANTGGSGNPATRGYEAFERGEYEMAASALSKHLEAHPSDAQSRYILGVCLHRLGSEVDALAEVNRAHDDAPALPEPIVFLAERELEARRTDRGKAMLEKAIRLQPPPSRACLLLGRLLMREGMEGRGAELLAIGLGEGDEPPHVLEMLLLAEHLSVRVPGLDRSDEEGRARRLFERARRAIAAGDGADRPLEHASLLARAHLGLGNGPEALEAARSALDLASGHERATALMVLAGAAHLAGREAEALERAAEATSDGPDLDVRLRAIALYDRMGRPDLSRSVLDRTATDFSGNVDVLRLWAAARRGDGAGAELAREISDLAGERADRPEVVALRARALSDAGEHERSAKLIAEEESVHPGNRSLAIARVRTVLTEIAGFTDDVPDAALAQIDRVLARLRRDDPFDAAAFVLAGRVALLRGRAAEAGRLAEEALSLDPRDIDAAAIQGLALAVMKEWETAAERISAVIRRSGSRPAAELVIEQARCFIEMDLEAEGADILAGLLDRAPDVTEARTLLLTVLVGSGRRPEAEKWVEPGDGGGSPSLDSVLAGAYRALDDGDLRSARAAVIRARVFARSPEEERAVAGLRKEIERRSMGPVEDRGHLGLLDRTGEEQDPFLRGDVLLASGRALAAVRDYELIPVGGGNRLAALRRIFEAGLIGKLPDETARSAAAITEESGGDLESYLMGRRMLGGLIAGGVGYLSAYAEQSPGDAQGRFAAAAALLMAGRIEPATEHAIAALRLAPESSHARTLLAELAQLRAEAFFDQGDLRGAAKLLSRLPVPQPLPETEAAYPTAVLLAFRHLSGSGEAASAALEARPGSLAARRVLGLSRLAEGRTEEAAAVFLAAVRADGSTAYDRFLLAAALLDAGKASSAAPWAAEAMETAAHPFFGGDLAISIAQARGSLEPVEAALRSLLTERKDDPRILTLLGRTLAARGRVVTDPGRVTEERDVADDARGCLDRAVKLDPKDVWALWLLVRCELQSFARTDAVLAEARFRLMEREDDPELVYLLAWLVDGWGSPSEARELAADALELAPGEPRAARLRARLALADGDPEKALETLAGGSDPETTVLLAEALIAAGRRADAAARYRHALRTCPRYPPALTGLGELLLATPGGWREARPLITDALAAAPDDPVLLLLLGQVRLAAGDLTGASGLVRRALTGLKKARGALGVIGDRGERAWLIVRKTQLEALERRIEEAEAVKAEVGRRLRGK